MGKAREHCCNFHVGGINYAGAMLIVANHLGAYFESVPPFLPVYFLYTRSGWVRKKEYDIKEKVRIKKYEIIKGSFPYPPFSHAFSLAGQYWEASTGNSKFEIYGTGLSFSSEGTE